MQIRYGKVPRARQLARLGGELSREARQRLLWMDYYRIHGHNAALTCRRFGISRQTFYRWKRRFDPHTLSSLEDLSHRPHQCRRPTWTPRLVEQVLRLRQQFPRWGKDKLVVLLRRQGAAVSTSMVGRILSSLKAHGRLHEPPRPATAARRSRKIRHRPWAVRKPRFWRIEQPGDVVQIDSKQLRPTRGVVLQHFSARDMVSRWDVVQVHARATAATATAFLDALLERMPFRIAALQVDGGSEFAAEFEQACQARGLPLFVLPRCSPKLNGHVERAHRTHNEEFYEIAPTDWSLPQLNRQLRNWETIYNTVRPHQALDYLTPQQFLTQWRSKRKEPECH
jgi:transposase InsO family protein